MVQHQHAAQHLIHHCSSASHGCISSNFLVDKCSPIHRAHEVVLILLIGYAAKKNEMSSSLSSPVCKVHKNNDRQLRSVSEFDELAASAAITLRYAKAKAKAAALSSKEETAAICTTVNIPDSEKSQQQLLSYLEEWILYNLLGIGFAHIYIYDTFPYQTTANHYHHSQLFNNAAEEDKL